MKKAQKSHWGKLARSWGFQGTLQKFDETDKTIIIIGLKLAVSFQD